MMFARTENGISETRFALFFGFQTKSPDSLREFFLCLRSSPWRATEMRGKVFFSRVSDARDETHLMIIQGAFRINHQRARL